MIVKQLRPMTFEVTLHAFELATLISAARWAVEGRQGEITPAAREQLEQVLRSFEGQRSSKWEQPSKREQPSIDPDPTDRPEERAGAA